MSVSDQVQDAATSFGDMLKANPIGASLIGMGLFWMVAGARAGEAMMGAARATAIPAVPKISDIPDRFGAVASTAREAMQDSARVAGDYVSGVADAAQKGFGDIADTATKAMRDHGATSADAYAFLDATRRSVGRMLTAQPLLLAAGGLALGAAVAASLPRTEVEARTLGDTADEVKRRAGALVADTTGAAKASLQNVATTAQNEAEKRGLTPDALRNKAGDVLDRAGDAMREAGKDAGLL